MSELPDNSRRKFIKTVSGGLLATTLPGLSMARSAKETHSSITILYTNDVHSHIDPFDDNHPKYPGQGGVAERSAIINKIRNQERNVLLFDAGDIFQGTPYFNLYGGELEFKLMSLMQYDAVTLGNHDFDNGVEGLVKQMHHAKFPFINSNYGFENSLLKDRTIPYKIFNKENIRVGVFGLGIELSGLVNPHLYGNIYYKDPVEVGLKISSYLKTRRKCDLVICLSHLGYIYSTNKISDLQLARKSMDIDMIIGGHTHTFLNEPTIEKNSAGREVIVTQAGWAGLRLGRSDFYFDRGTGTKISAIHSMKEMRKSSEK